MFVKRVVNLNNKMLSMNNLASYEGSDHCRENVHNLVRQVI